MGTFNNLGNTYATRRKSTPVRTRTRPWTRNRPIYPISTVRKHRSFLPQDSGFDRENLNWPNSKVSNHIQQGQPIYIGGIPLWIKHYSCRTFRKKKGLDLKKTYHIIHSLLTNRGLKPNLYILDNEFTNFLKNLIREVNEKFQLVPPHIHSRNSAERAIQSFKEHFIAGLYSTHKKFPLHLWFQLIPHASLTLNLLRKSCMNPKLSGYAQLDGEFNYNATPLAPLGTQVIACENQQWEELEHHMEWKDGILVLPWSTIGAITYMLLKQEETMTQTVLIFPIQYSTPLQLFLRKCHHRGALIGPCPAEPINPSAIFQHWQLLNGSDWATLRYFFQCCS